MGVGGALLFNYGVATPHLFTFWGDADWLRRADVVETITDPWRLSVFFHFTAPWQWIVFHALFLLACAAFTVGWRTSWVKWIVLIGHISYAYRNPVLTYGADAILHNLLFILCFAPIGRAMSLDRVRAVRAAKRSNLGSTLPPYSSPWAFACTRLMQIQMAVLFFSSGGEKLRGIDWWTGDAIWNALVSNEYYTPMVGLFAAQYWLIVLATYGTVLVELAFPFLIWQRRTRPYFLAAAVLLHAMIAIIMGLHYFSFVMIMGHLSFLRHEWLTRLGTAWKRKMDGMEMIYDGTCGFCVRSMAWLLAFDGLGQIKIRDFRTDPSPVVGEAQLETALYLVLSDGRALPGFDAYRYVVLRVPGLWWQIPFFYVPVFSRLIGRPAYKWVAANRHRL